MSTFTAEFNVTGAKRKELVTRISEIMECPSKYLGPPSFAYQVDYITIDRNGNISFDDRADTEQIGNSPYMPLIWQILARVAFSGKLILSLLNVKTA